jgi:hypothetical protein
MKKFLSVVILLIALINTTSTQAKDPKDIFRRDIGETIPAIVGITGAELPIMKKHCLAFYRKHIDPQLSGFSKKLEKYVDSTSCIADVVFKHSGTLMGDAGASKSAAKKMQADLLEMAKEKTRNWSSEFSEAGDQKRQKGCFNMVQNMTFDQEYDIYSELERLETALRVVAKKATLLALRTDLRRCPIHPLPYASETNNKLPKY